MTEATTQATLETRADAGEDSGAIVKLWLDAIELSDKHEKDWRKRAKEVKQIYRNTEKKKAFNILYSNTQTLFPAIYNTPPLPDIRPRYKDTEPLAKDAAQILERAVGYEIDAYDLDQVMRGVVLDGILVGRGVPRIRYEPVLSADQSAVVFQKTTAELVQWDSLRIGPAKQWADVPWTAFEHFMTRTQLIALNPSIGALINLDTTINGVKDDKANEAPDLFKRARVWEIWDREGGEVLFIAPSYKDQPLLRVPPDIQLNGFYPIPRPFYAFSDTDTLEPIEPYRLYEEQAEELDRVCKRIKALIKCLKWRGVSAKALNDIMKLEDAEDGDIVPADNDFQMLANAGGLDKAIWFMPIDKLISTIQGLYDQREQIKQVIYEITGIADILRGSTKPDETLGAQQLKAQWGSLRINDLQAEAQRVARDLIRMKCEIIAEKFDPAILQMITGIQVLPEVAALLKNDPLRSYRIDIETDSTIRADLNRSQQNVSNFVQGLSSYLQAVGPAVQSGLFPLPVAVDLLTAFARVFKLGRQAEDSLDSLKQSAEQQISQQQQMQQLAGMQPTGLQPLPNGQPQQQMVM